MNGSPAWRVLYFLVLGALACLVLAAFVKPTDGRHGGLNECERAKFLDMVEGQAHKPFVCRVLLPTTVRGISALVPDRVEQAAADRIEASAFARERFADLGWETEGAFRYLAASVLFLLCFIGFGHGLVLLTERTCDLTRAGPTRLLLAAGALAGLPAFFRYASYPYDPAQLFLFTCALLMLVTDRPRAFGAFFVLCCLNKETAILLIPLFWLAYRDRPRAGNWLRVRLLTLIVLFAAIKIGLMILFRGNPGGLTEFHLLRNLAWLARGWTFTDLTAFLVLLGLVTFRWSEKPVFLRQGLLWALLPLFTLALFLGYADEWRGYYEAYPLAFGLVVHSIRRLRESVGGAGKLTD